MFISTEEEEASSEEEEGSSSSEEEDEVEAEKASSLPSPPVTEKNPASKKRDSGPWASIVVINLNFREKTKQQRERERLLRIMMLYIWTYLTYKQSIGDWRFEVIVSSIFITQQNIVTNHWNPSLLMRI
jgi:hypothetical protein